MISISNKQLTKNFMQYLVSVNSKENCQCQLKLLMSNLTHDGCQMSDFAIQISQQK